MLEITSCKFFPFSVTENTSYYITSYISYFLDSIILPSENLTYSSHLSLSFLLSPLYNFEKKGAHLGKS